MCASLKVRGVGGIARESGVTPRRKQSRVEDGAAASAALPRAALDGEHGVIRSTSQQDRPQDFPNAIFVLE
jgi:hypothetical protein